MCTVGNLGNGALEDTIRNKVESVLKDHPGITASVMGCNQNDNWEVRIQNPAKQKSWIATLTMHENQTAEKAIKFVRDGIASVD
jgi:hypothetical protein